MREGMDSLDGYTGSQVEAEILGSCLEFSGWDTKKIAEKSQEEQQEDMAQWVEGHLGMSRAAWRRMEKEEQLEKLLEWSRANQQKHWNPAEPLFQNSETSKMENDLGCHLHDAIAEGLGLEDYSGLKLYSCVDTPQDNYFHTDCFVDFEGVTLSIDVTIDPAKKDGNRWDPLFKVQNAVLFLGKGVDLEEIETKGKEIGSYIKRVWERRKKEQEVQTVDA